MWYDNTAAAPTSPTQNQFGNEAVRAAIYFGQNTSALTTDAMYFIMSATGNNIAQFGSYYCAYHDYKAATFGNVAYANIPYITDAGYSCGAGFNGLGNNAGITMQVGHELVEMITNPLATGGWMDRNASEIGDKCQYIGTGSPGAVSNIQLPTGTFPLQSVWSNADAGCVSTFGTVAPTLGPTRSPTSPTIVPSRRPTAPTVTPSMTPTSPSIFPSFSPSNTPSLRPTRTPSNVPVKTVQPVFSKRPSRSPTFKPSTSLSPATVKTVSTGQGTTGSDNMILMLVIIVSVLVLLLLLLLLCTIIRRIRSARVSKQAINEDELEGALSNAGIHSRSPSRQNIDPTGAVSPNMSPSSSSRTRSMRGINSRGVSIRSRMVSVDSDIQDIMHNSSFREFAHKSDSDIKYDPINSI